MKNDTDRKGRHYYRLDLTSDHPSQLLNYRRLNHHISIYELEDPSNPVLSQYHYTAYFKDESQRTWQLHAYFSGNDDCLDVCFSIISKESPSPLSSSTQIPEHLDALAITCVQPIISSLRAAFAKKITTLETTYIRLEQETSALSPNLEAQAGEYQTKLKETIQTLDELYRLTNQPTYASIRKFMKRLALAVANKISVQPDSTSIEDASVPALSTPPVTSKPSCSKPKQSRRFFKPKISLDSSIQALNTRFNDAKQRFHQATPGKGTHLPQVLSNLLSEAYSLTLLVEEASHTSSLQALMDLQTLHRDLILFGEKQFSIYLVQREFENAAQLTCFHYLLGSKYVNLALQLRQEALLEFVLKHSKRNVITSPVSIMGKQYPSAVHACIQCHSPSFSMVGCLVVLLKHGASLMARDDRGLPLAHYLVSTENHPLGSAVNQAREHTLDSPKFFSQLLSALRLYLLQPGIDAEERAHLQKIIVLYEYNKIQAIYFQELKKDSLGQRLVELFIRSEPYYARYPQLKKIMAAPDTLKMMSELKQLETSHLQKCNRAERKKWLENALEQLTTTEKGLVDGSIENIQDEEIESIKSMILAGIQQQIDNVSIEMELIQLKRSRQPMSKPEKMQYNQLISDYHQSITSQVLQAIGEVEGASSETVLDLAP
jgi:hypothetical protein